MKIKTFAYTIAAFLTLVSFNSFGQTSKSDTIKAPHNYWASFGGGYSSLGVFAGHLNANAQISRKGIITASFQLEVNNAFGHAATDNIQLRSYNLLAGKIHQQKISFFTIAAGLGVVNVVSYDGKANRYGEFVTTNRTDRFTIGIPVMVQEYLVVAQTVGFGIHGYVNLNTIRSTVGFTVNMALGSMAKSKR